NERSATESPIRQAQGRPTPPWEQTTSASCEHAIEGADDRLDRGEFDVGIDSRAEERLAAFCFDLNIAHRLGLRAHAEGVFGVAQHFEFRQCVSAERPGERIDGAIAVT